MEMNVSALVSEATIENMTAHHGSERSATKYCCASSDFFRARHQERLCRRGTRRGLRSLRRRTRSPAKSFFPVYAEKELPQPQPPVALGFLNVKPEPCI